MLRSYAVSLLRLCLVLAALAPVGYHLTQRPAAAASADLRPLSKALVYLKHYYYKDLNTPKDTETLVDNAIKGMLGTLDPHTIYHKASSFERMQEEQKGEFAGIGITFSIQNKFITVISAIEDTPSYRLGIQAGDQIVKIEGEDVKGITSNEVVSKLRGKPGTKVNITIRRPGEAELLNFDIVRERIPLFSVPYAFMLDDKTGYVSISNFAERTALELKEKLEELKKAGMQQILLDLRGNPGGLLKAAQDVSSLFLPRGVLIVETKGRIPDARMELYSESKDPITSMPLVVLVDEGSASASEIVSGAVQDHDRGIIVGKRTFGKGLVQRLYDLQEGAALQVTTAQYYTPSGRCIQKPFLNKDFQLHPEEFNGTKKKSDGEPDETPVEKYYTDKNRVVYGGGGVMPDIEVEPNLFAPIVFRMRMGSHFFNFALEYVQANKATLKEDIEVTPALLEQFKTYLRGKSFEFEEADFTKEATAISAWLAREIGSTAYKANVGQKNFAKYDSQVKAALESLEDAAKLVTM